MKLSHIHEYDARDIHEVNWKNLAASGALLAAPLLGGCVGPSCPTADSSATASASSAHEEMDTAMEDGKSFPGSHWNDQFGNYQAWKYNGTIYVSAEDGNYYKRGEKLGSRWRAQKLEDFGWGRSAMITDYMKKTWDSDESDAARSHISTDDFEDKTVTSKSAGKYLK